MAINPARPDLMAGELLLDAMLDCVPKGLGLVKDFGLHVWRVGSMLASLEATSMGVDLAGEQMKKTVGVNVFENNGLSFVTVAKLAHYPEELAGYLYDQLKNEYQIFKGLAPGGAGGRLIARELSLAGIQRFGSEAGSLSKGLVTELIMRGKIFTGLPAMAFGMGGGCFISNAEDFLLGDMIEKRFGAEWRSRASFISFFAPQIIGERLTFKFLSNKVVSRLAPPVAAVAGTGFAYELTSSSIRYLSRWERASYELSLAYDAVKQRPKGIGQTALEFLLGDGVSAQMCAGDNPIAWMVDGAEWLQSEVYGTRRRDETCKYLRGQARLKNIKEAEKYVEWIKQGLKEYIILSGYAGIRPSSVDDWRRLISAGWLAKVDKNIVSNTHGLPRDIVSVIANTSYIMEDVAEPIRELFSAEIKTSGRLAGPGREADVILWVGGEGVILSQRKKLFLATAMEAMIKGDGQMMKLAEEIGYSPEFYFSILNDYVDKAIEVQDEPAIRFLQRYLERCYADFIRKEKEGDGLLAGEYLANVLIIDPARIYEEGSVELELYMRALDTNAARYLRGCGYLSHLKPARDIAQRIEDNVRNELSYHVALQTVLGGAPLEGPSYDEQKMTKMLKRACRLREISGSKSEAGELLKLFMWRGALDDRVAVIAALGQGPSINIGELKQGSKEVFKPLSEKLMKVLSDTVNSIEETESEENVEEAFKMSVDNSLDFNQKLAELAADWKLMGNSGPLFGGAINPDGTLGDMSALKMWIDF